MSCILAFDEGTTSARAIVFELDGRIRSLARKEIRQSYPRPGWVEHDPIEIWTAQSEVAVRALAEARMSSRDIAAVGITNQRETTVLWDRQTGEPVHPAIVWQDRRTAELCDRLRGEGHESMVQQRTGLLLDAYFSGTKLAWLLDYVPGARARANAGELAFGTIDTWLIWKLTDGKRHITDVTNASRTLLFNLRSGEWDPELLRLLKIPESLLPEIVSSSGELCEISAPAELKGLRVCGIAGDQQAALFGQMCIAPGLTKNTYGTGCFMLQNSGLTAPVSRHRLLSTVAWKIAGRTEFAIEGSVFIGGAVVQWLRDSLKVIRSSGEIEALAASVPDNGGVYLVPAFAGLGAPHWDPYARGVLAGLTRDTNSGHLARAALESIAFQVADLEEAMQNDTGIPVKELRADGGASGNNLLLQFQADILGVPVVRPAVTESTALGAAYLAGLAAGCWKDRETIGAQWKVERRFEPRMARERVLEMKGKWREAVERAKGWER
jgi:glycerol kinase